MLKLTLQYFDHLTQSQLIVKDPDAGKDWGQEEKGTTEDKMTGWYYWFNEHESQQTLAHGEGQGSLACCSPWGSQRVNATEQQNKKCKVTKILSYFLSKIYSSGFYLEVWGPWWCEVWVCVHFVAYGSPIVPALFVEKTTLSPLPSLCIFVKHQ